MGASRVPNAGVVVCRWMTRANSGARSKTAGSLGAGVCRQARRQDAVARRASWTSTDPRQTVIMG